MKPETGLPLVSVVMAVYNGERYLSAAIASILHQTWKNFEFIIINDGSTDGTAQILAAYQQQDRRVQVYDQTNQGLTRSLNRGLQLAQGDYIARMDADDLSLPRRLARQVQFMETHPDIGLCGSWIRGLGESAGAVNQYPVDHATICAWLLFDSAFAHPTVMLRRQTFAAQQLTYDPTYQYCQDYDLWRRCSRQIQLANLPEILLHYRTHGQQMGQVYSQTLRGAENYRVYTSQLTQLGLPVTAAVLQLHQTFRLFDVAIDRDFLEQAHNWLWTIHLANQQTQIYQSSALAKVLGHRWFGLCYRATHLGSEIWQRFWQSPLSQMAPLSGEQTLKFALKSHLSHGTTRRLNP
ncbi:glycosyltransferase family 2 protein [Neosynechococcus sphagnicola]|uniref:glycosyltransferase family 2 protein n=1 Tax=Neosynechococcus sphagnicola TaxID=1501145 RepID=UPI00068A0B59|nr:glycosyltransferase family A protein [Neosynechococcus sphagnicola]